MYRAEEWNKLGLKKCIIGGQRQACFSNGVGMDVRIGFGIGALEGRDRHTLLAIAREQRCQCKKAMVDWRG